MVDGLTVSTAVPEVAPPVLNVPETVAQLEAPVELQVSATFPPGGTVALSALRVAVGAVEALVGLQQMPVWQVPLPVVAVLGHPPEPV